MSKDIKNYPLVSLYKTVMDTTAMEQNPVLQVLFKINNGTYRHLVEPATKAFQDGNTELYAELKKKIPSFIISGTYEGGRKAENLKDYSGYLILDIDKLPKDEIKNYKQKIAGVPFTFACFISPSGVGLKIIVKVSSNPTEHLQAFNQLKAIYEKATGVEIDKSGKDINRLCFFSCDSNIVINYEAQKYLVQHEEVKQTTIAPVQHFTKGTDDLSIFQKCVELTNNKMAYVEGNRNNYVNLLANNCNRNGLSELSATHYINSHYNYNDAEVSQTIKSAYHSHTAEHGKFSKQSTPVVPIKDFSNTGAVPLKQLIHRANTEPDTPFIWSGIKENSFGFIFGPSKSGKTTICENLAMALVAGLTEFMGQSITKGIYKVFFLSLEEYWKPRSQRNAKQTQYLIEHIGNDNWLDNYSANDDTVPRQISSEEEWLLLETLIKKNGANFVIIDSLSRLYEGGIEDSGLAKKVALRLRELCNRLKITLIIIHHTPKQIGRPITIDSLAGSRMLAQEADFMIGVGKSPEGKRYIKDVAFRYKQEDSENVMTFDINSYQYAVEGIQLPETVLLKETDGREDSTNADAILEYIDEKSKSQIGGCYLKDLTEHFVTGKIISRATLFNCLEKLQKDGKISKPSKGQYKSTQ